MNRIKTSLVGLVLLLSVGVTAAVNSNSKKLVTYCSQYPFGGGSVGPLSQFGCSAGFNICCYRVADNFVYYRP